MASLRLPPLHVLAPLSRIVDRVAMRRMRGGPKILRFVPAPGLKALAVHDTDRAAFAALVRRFGQTRAAIPDWNGGYLEHVLGTGLDKPAFGDPVMAAVTTRSGEPVGAFLYHLRPGGIGRVLQVLFKRGRAGDVLDQMFADAMARGAVGLRGRTEPAILEAAPGRHMLCFSASSTVVHAKDAALLAPLAAGDCFLNGLAGERWSRFFGGGLS